MGEFNDYYERKQREADRLAGELEQARKDGDTVKASRIEQALDRARYVGD